MVECELCGKKADRKIEVENTIINACGQCSKFGREVEQPKMAVIRKRELKLPEEMEYQINTDLPKLVKRYRERLQITQEQLAAKIHEKVSIIKRIEDGWLPPLDIVRKLESEMKISLIEKIQDVAPSKRVNKKQLTIGDVAEVR